MGLFNAVAAIASAPGAVAGGAIADRFGYSTIHGARNHGRTIDCPPERKSRLDLKEALSHRRPYGLPTSRMSRVELARSLHENS